MTDDVTVVGRCGCGAVEVESNGQSGYFILACNFRRLFSVDRVPRAPIHFGCCDHCVNHYGLDLCACGSGEAPEKCKEGHKCCGQPSQVLEGRTCYRAENAWGLQ